MSLRLMSRAALLALTVGGLLGLLAALVGAQVPARELVMDPDRSIVLVDAARSLSVPLTRGGEEGHSPVWSGDGEWLAYIRIVQDEQQVMVARPFGGGAPRAVYSSSAGDRGSSSVAWAPDGRELAFTAPLDGRQVIYTVPFAAEEPVPLPTQVTGSQVNAFSPSWSPDGRELAFSWSPAANAEVFVARLEDLSLPINGDRDLKRLTQTPVLDTSPSWSPDGRLIAFTSDRDDNSEIYLMAADGSGLRRMTRHTARDVNPTWTPDGLYIWFASNRGGGWQIYQMRADCPGDCPAERISPLSGSTLHAALRP